MSTSTITPATVGDALRSTGYLPSEGLSTVLFLATANVADTIPDALLDRMEVVRLDGYTEDEKVAIARNHLLPRQLSRAALDETEVEVDDDALRLIAGEHTREAGVRQLERGRQDGRNIR